MQSTLSVSSELKNLKLTFDQKLESSLKTLVTSSLLTQSLEHCLMSGGKRIRPIIVLLVAEALGFDLDVLPAAIAVEFFHTASLIADDLPCMDNDDFRRNRLTLHKAFDEKTAILTSYGLIAEAFKKIEENGSIMKEAPKPFCEQALQAVSIGLECASRCAGFSGATLGQFQDLAEKPSGVEELERTIYLKTITLFEGSFVLGWVFGGGELALVSQVKKLSYHFGLAFQIRDDLEDLEQDTKRESSANYALALGESKARARLFFEVQKLKSKLSKLKIYSEQFQEILSLLFPEFLSLLE